MGGLCSKSLHLIEDNAYTENKENDTLLSGQTRLIVPQPQSLETPQEPKELRRLFPDHDSQRSDVGTNPNDFYDGIPRFTRNPSHKSRSARSTQAAVAKVNEVSSRLGRAGTLGLGKAVDVLDTLGSSMTNLNPSSGFGAGYAAKGNELEVLAFEVANTIVKGSNLMQSLSKKNIRHLKDVVLHSKGVQNLVSKDMDELLNTVASDKREELKIFSGEVIRFGNRSKDPQWHNLERYFDKISRELIPQRQLELDAEFIMEQLMISVQYTAELYHELQVLERLEQDYTKRHEEDHKGGNIAILKAELKTQRKQVRSIKKKSLWSTNLEEVMEKFVDIIQYLLLEIHKIFGDAVSDKGAVSDRPKLGTAGLALHYANIVLQIDSLVARSSSIPPNSRDALYQNLPPGIKSSIRTKMRNFHVKDELTVTDIKYEMEKTLHWLVPIATNTSKAHHGFGWVGEWANTGADATRKSAGESSEVIRVETLHHADKEKTEAYILEQVLWLQYLVKKSKAMANKLAIKSVNIEKKEPCSATASLTIEEHKMLEEASNKKRVRGTSNSKSQDFDLDGSRLEKHDRLSKSSNYSAGSRRKERDTVKIIDFFIDKKKTLDMIDRVD